jgi:Protein of unknown function (DUF3726).
MSTHIKLSQNELLALLTRTFEALFGHERDYYDMAKTVLWLECHGHHGVEQMISALPVLEHDNLAKPALSELSSNHIVIDGSGRSLICLSQTICDLVMAGAAENRRSRADIINVSDSKPLLGVLNCAATQGFSAIAICREQLAIITADVAYPTVYKNNGIDSLSLICAQTDEKLSDYFSQTPDVLVDVSTQKDAFVSSLEHGLNIKRVDYNALTMIANRVLVEATEASRQGAGE